MLYVKWLSALALLISVGWFIVDPGFEPGLSVVVSFSALISAFLIDKRRVRHTRQQLSVSRGGIGLQAGRDVNVSNINGGKNVEQ